MQRRAFITLLGGAAATWPLAAHAQQPPMPVAGFLSSLSPLELTFVMPAFHQGLNEAGFVEGRNIAIEYRWAEGHYERLPALAADLVRRQVAVIAAISGTPAALAAKAATTTIPIVFAIGGDPVAPGLVTNLSRPGGNITGASFYTSPVVTKRLELARELAPRGTTIALLVNPENPPSVIEGTTLQKAAAALGQPIEIINASTEGQIDRAFTAVAQQKFGALVVSSDPLFFIARDMLVILTARYALPTIFADREQAEAGGLISYGARRPDAYRQAGNYVGRVVEGEKPGDLPVVLPTKYTLLVNLKTAKTLGLSLPPSVLARADEVIE
ncbi:MAG: ABC transporter substrate-binding protein [Bradyrhizobium sp.]|jgi:putative tryptophan/tyrosine transport system substrate-binding protein|uniref:ABC transporter substrate-binding protein n=2 Tax=Bradyrhizobium sp. TaxID=376 RepID=UPI003C7B59D3